MKRIFVSVLSLALWAGLGTVWAQQDSGTAPAPANNTKVNRRDRNRAEPTAQQQKENPTDRQLAKEVRRALVKDKSLSSDAHNVKVIAQNGAVTLKGPVKSEQEKAEVEQKAAEVAGADKVTSEIQVEPGK